MTERHRIRKRIPRKLRKQHGESHTEELPDPLAKRDSTLVFYRSWIAESGLMVLFCFSLGLWFWGSARVPASVQLIPLEDIIGLDITLPLPLFGLPALILFCCILQRHFNYLFEIGEDHVLTVKGRIALRLQDTRIDYENVRGVEIDQTLLQRMLGIGDLKIGSSMHADIELCMPGVRHPEQYRSIIEMRIKEHFSKLGSATTDHPQTRRHGGDAQHGGDRRRYE